MLSLSCFRCLDVLRYGRWTIVERRKDFLSACSFLYADRLGRGVQRGATPLAYWEIFSGHGVKREENPLISYGIFCPAKISVPCLHLPFPFVLAPEAPSWASPSVLPIGLVSPKAYLDCTRISEYPACLEIQNARLAVTAFFCCLYQRVLPVPFQPVMPLPFPTEVGVMKILMN